MYVYQFEDVIVYETLGGYKYSNTGTIVNNIEELQKEIIKEFGEPLEIEY